MNSTHPADAATLTAAPMHVAFKRRTADPQTPIERLRTALHTWRHRRRSRLDLLALDDHLLKDIGLTRAQVHVEASKPFWRD